MLRVPEYANRVYRMADVTTYVGPRHEECVQMGDDYGHGEYQPFGSSYASYNSANKVVSRRCLIAPDVERNIYYGRWHVASISWEMYHLVQSSLTMACLHHSPLGVPGGLRVMSLCCLDAHPPPPALQSSANNAAQTGAAASKRGDSGWCSVQ